MGTITVLSPAHAKLPRLHRLSTTTRMLPYTLPVMPPPMITICLIRVMNMALATSKSMSPSTRRLARMHPTEVRPLPLPPRVFSVSPVVVSQSRWPVEATTVTTSAAGSVPLTPLETMRTLRPKPTQTLEVPRTATQLVMRLPRLSAYTPPKLRNSPPQPSRVLSSTFPHGSVKVVWTAMCHLEVHRETTLMVLPPIALPSRTITAAVFSVARSVFSPRRPRYRPAASTFSVFT